jgi:serine/threonine protein kinase
MKTERYRQVQAMFTQVRKLPTEERDAFLDEACGPDAELRSLVERALVALDEDEPTPTVGRRAFADVAYRIGADGDRPPEPLPERIGPFRILQVLGEGGMGVVYEAEQTVSVSRRVALKVVRLGMDTKEVVARFEAERQALAFMDHPGIAHVLDAGATAEGRPWFSMELVKGLPLTAYCDREELSTRERLQLFVELCGAVQHAHQKGVIHRDLKPSNVLVTEVDGRAVPKVIDFGIAKAVGAALTERTLVTQLGQALGTPAYMAPEQSDIASLDVDTRADVYALGVMLFELLVGRLPFEMQGDWQELLRSLARGDKDTPTPSRRFSMLTGAEQSDIARRRRVAPGALRSELRGDLDWIVHRAMDPVRRRRYDTANGLAADVVRYLKNEPVVARPPTLGYRAQKFVKRNTLGVTVTALAAAFLMAFSVGMGMLWRRSEANLNRAVAAETEARHETRTAQQALDFLVGLFDNSDPNAIPGETVTAKQVVDRGAERLADTLRDEPLGRARLLYARGSRSENREASPGSSCGPSTAWAKRRTGRVITMKRAPFWSGPSPWRSRPWGRKISTSRQRSFGSRRSTRQTGGWTTRGA